jgi:pimeloyl-ACP methyl ester carboxylesterase
MARELPRARLTVIEGCGHIPPAECPERFLAVLGEVLAQAPPALDPVRAPGGSRG